MQSDNPQHGFQFPGTFELSAMGAADIGLEERLPRCLQQAGVRLIEDGIACRHSSNGRYVAVRMRFHAESREQYEQAHQVLRDHPDVKWTL